MPSIKWEVVRASPVAALKIVIVATFRSLTGLVKMIIHPRQPMYLRTMISRAWIGTAFYTNPDIFYGVPVHHDTERFEIESGGAYAIPNIKPGDLETADVVMIYVHGGGMIIGNPLQYLDEYKRWVALAEHQGKKLVVLAPQYPLATASKWPAQRESLLGLYSWALSQSVSPSRIVMGGDSAGANIILLSLLHVRDFQPQIPQPAAAFLHSPAVDLSAEETWHTPRVAYDYIWGYNEIVPFVNSAPKPDDLPWDTPEISALLWESLAGLPPQLVYYSETEILATDSSRWIEKSKKAGGDVTVYKKSGQLHTFGLGWPFVGKKIQDECDALLMEFIFRNVRS